VIEPLLTPAFAVSVFAVTLGGIVRGFAGSGSGLVMIPLMSLVYWPPQALTIAILIGVVGGIQMIPQTVRHVRWRDVLPMAATALVAIPIGTTLLFLVDPEISRRSIGGLVLFSSIILLSGWTYRGPRNPLTSATAGVVAGLVNGFAGAGSVIPTLYFVASQERAVILRANIFTVVSIFIFITAIALAFRGTVTWETVTIAAALLVPYGITIWIGSHLFHRSSDRMYRLAVLWLLAAIGTFVAFV
jgi:uncharacterized membrane protein YfcA